MSTDDLKQRVQAAIGKDSRAMTSMIAKQLGVPEAEVIRYLPDNRSTELDPKRAKELIEKFGALGKVHVIVNNGAVVLEAFGEFGGISITGPFLNVQTESLDMHIRQDLLASVFAVEKPSHMDGVGTISFQFFTPEGNAAFKVFLSFGAKPPTPERVTFFESAKAGFKRQ